MFSWQILYSKHNLTFQKSILIYNYIYYKHRLRWSVSFKIILIMRWYVNHSIIYVFHKYYLFILLLQCLQAKDEIWKRTLREMLKKQLCCKLQENWLTLFSSSRNGESCLSRRWKKTFFFRFSLNLIIVPVVLDYSGISMSF